MTSDQFHMTSGQFKTVNSFIVNSLSSLFSKKFFENSIFIMTSDQFHMTHDQFYMISGHFERINDQQWSQNQLVRLARDCLQKPQDPKILEFPGML